MSKENNHIQPNVDSGEITINIGEILRVLKSYYLFIGITSFIFAGIGAIYSLTLANEYISTVKLLPEMDNKSGGSNFGGLKSIAGLAGVDLGSGLGSDLVKPDIYPSIVQSTPFLLEALQSKVYVQKHKKWLKVYDYLLTYPETPPLQIPGYNKSSPTETKVSNITVSKTAISSELIQLNKDQFNAVNNLKSRITAEFDKKSGVIMISVKMTDPVAAANLTSFTQSYLTKYVTSYRMEKVLKELKFLQDRHGDARKAYDNALSRLSTYRDQHRNTFLQVAKDHEKKLQYEVDIAFNLYAGLSTQLTDTKVKVQRETPVFKELEPAQVPLQKSDPKRSIITLSFMVFGLFLSLVIVFFRTINLKQWLA
ncbi:Wzz/FepE/Etk N-terminal domain-containing protein [Aquirufa aurantiipilula]|uniref:Wzz/FepE/Etk N-terminal domain-containing protein n=1 Tax=Aquirufa aurantiipilula TaxID=2696561 RepID=A0ABT6BHX3_9BACT|nr:Wzz/FepE/Etk N-terminal domain-containing protein [Aquirufa aurantiipilula]MDF5689504.1 Wzz/FepE/Etk N-terminal domain-containing protein [Aquirufa aurantiipilula]